MKKIWLGFISICMLLALSGCGNDDNEKSTDKTTPAANDIVKVEMIVDTFGTIELELYKDIAPITVKNFVKLVNEKFYDGLTFHRIISGFMVQGGDPKGDGTGGSEETIKGEFEENGISNSLSHKRGVLSMARSNDPDSASSQFFIMHEDTPSLDGKYAAFGKVTSGLDVVDKLAEVQVEDADSGSVSTQNQPKITSIRIIK